MDTLQIKKDHIEEYFSKTENGRGTELFRIDDTNSDIKTELSEEEIRLVNILKMNDEFLVRKGLKPIYSNYYRNFLRLKISLNRQGRTEYVKINQNDNSEETLNRLANFTGILGAKKP